MSRLSETHLFCPQKDVIEQGLNELLMVSGMSWMLRLDHTQREGPLLQIRGGCSVHFDAVQHTRPQD